LVFCDRVKKLGTDDAPIRAIHRDIAWTQIALGGKLGHPS